MKKKNSVDILTGPIWRQLLLFFFPIMLGTLLQQIYNTADTMIVGNFVGKEALAAVGGSPFYMMNIFISFSIGLSSGCSVIIAQYFGARKHKPLSQAIHTSLALSAIFGLVISVSMFFLGKSILTLMRVPDDAFAYSLRYLRIVSWGFVFTMIYNMCTAVFRAIGDSRTPLYFLVVCAILNVGLNVLFVVGLRLDVAGVAIATVISQFVCVVLSLGTLVLSREVWKVRISAIRIHPLMLPKLLRIAIPRALQSTSFSLANVILQSSFNLLGTPAVAGWAVDRKIEQVFPMIVGSFGVAVTVFTAQNYGAKKIDRVKKGLRVCLQINAALTALISLFTFFVGPKLCRYFTNDAEVLGNAALMIRFLSPFYLSYIFYELMAGFLYGIGISLAPMLMTGFGIGIFRLIWVWLIIGNRPDIYKIIGCYPASWGLTSLLFLCYYWTSKRKKERIG